MPKLPNKNKTTQNKQTKQNRPQVKKQQRKSETVAKFVKINITSDLTSFTSLIHIHGRLVEVLSIYTRLRVPKRMPWFNVRHWTAPSCRCGFLFEH